MKNNKYEWLALVLAVVSSVSIFFFLPSYKEGHYINISSSMATISGVLLGFVTASITMLYSAQAHKLIVNAKKTGHFQDLLRRLQELMVLLFLSCILFLLALLIPDTICQIRDVLVCLGVGVFVSAFTLFWSVWRLFTKFVSFM